MVSPDHRAQRDSKAMLVSRELLASPDHRESKESKVSLGTPERLARELLV